MKVGIGICAGLIEAVVIALLANIRGFDPVFWGLLTLGLCSAAVVGEYLLNLRRGGGPRANQHQHHSHA